jgi:hypothetical protein
MAASGVLTCALGFASFLPMYALAGLIMVHMLIMGDSSASPPAWSPAQQGIRG